MATECPHCHHTEEHKTLSGCMWSTPDGEYGCLCMDNGQRCSRCGHLDAHNTGYTGKGCSYQTRVGLNNVESARCLCSWVTP